MAFTLVQQKGVVSEPQVTTLATELESAATLGNLLVSRIAPEKSAGTNPAPSEGWTAVAQDVDVGISVALAYRLADGTAKDKCTWTWTTKQSTTGSIHEFNFPGTPLAPVVATDYSDGTQVKNVEMGPIVATGSSLAFAFVALDSFGDWGSDATATNAFSSILKNGSDGGGEVFIKEVQRGAEVSVKIEGTGPFWEEKGDQASGVLALFGVTPRTLTLLGAGR